MDEEKAQNLLEGFVHPDGSIYSLGRYAQWYIHSTKITLDDKFTVEELEAFVWWMKNKKKPQA